MSEPVAEESPYKGDERVVATCTVGLWGAAFIVFFERPLLALVLVLAWGMGLMVGLHVQAIREARWRDRCHQSESSSGTP